MAGGACRILEWAKLCVLVLSQLMGTFQVGRRRGWLEWCGGDTSLLGW